MSTATLTKVGQDTKFEVTFKKDLPNGLYTYNFEITSNFANGFNIYMYGGCGGARFYAKTMYRYWAANYASGDDFNPVKQGASGNGVKGGYFLRGVGRKVQVHGGFQNFGDSIVNYGKPYTLNVHGMDGKTYEFMYQKLTPNYLTNKILGLCLIFVIEPASNGTMDLTSDSYFL